MKRLPQPQVEQIARDTVRLMICKHGERNLNRLTLAIRRQVRQKNKPLFGRQLSS